MNPVAWLLDPVAVKELSGSARRWQTYVARGLYVALCGVILWNYADDIRESTLRYTPSSYARLGKRLFTSFLVLQAGLLMLSGVSAASDLLSKEVRLGTLGVLACSPLSPWRIAFGKWKAAFAQTSMMLLCGMPVFAVCVYLGGTGPRELLSGFCVSLAAAALSVSVGLFCSSLFRSPAGSLITAVSTLAAYTFLPILLENEDFWPEVFAHTQLAYALHFTIDSLRPRQAWLADAWMSACGVTAALSLLLVRLTASRIAKLAVRTPTVPLITRIFAGLDRLYERINPGGIIVFGRGDAVWERRALLWKELQTRASGRLRNSIRISLLLLLTLATTYWLDLRYLHIPVWISTILIWFLALSNGSSLFVKEKEERKWDILLATPLGSWEILGAKLLAGIVPVLPALAVFGLFWVSSILIARLTPTDILVSSLSIFLPAAFAYAVGAVCSLRAKSLRGSFTTAMTTVAAVALGIPLLCSDDHDVTSVRAAWICPVPYIEVMCRHGLQDVYYGEDITVRVLAFTLIYAGGTAALLIYLYSSFNHVSGRSEGR